MRQSMALVLKFSLPSPPWSFSRSFSQLPCSPSLLVSSLRISSLSRSTYLLRCPFSSPASATHSKPKPTPDEPVSSLLPAPLRLKNLITTLSPALLSPISSPSDLLELSVLLDDTFGLLSHSRPLRLAICGSQGRSDLVDSLLLDPLQKGASDADARIRNRPRPSKDQELLVIHHAIIDPSSSKVPTHHVPSRWLAMHDLSIHEIFTAPGRLPDPLPPCDIYLLVLDPFRDIALLDRLASQTHPFLVLLNPPALDLPTPVPVMHVDASRALTALHTLAGSSGADPAAYADLSASNLPQVQTMLSDTLASPDDVRLWSAIRHARMILERVRRLIAARRAALDAADARLADAGQTIETLTRAVHDALAIEDDPRPVGRALARLWKAELAWPMLALRPDEVGVRVMRTLVKTELERIEQRLIFNSGYLAGISNQINNLIQNLLEDPKLEITHTLENEVLQARPTVPNPHTLVQSLVRRIGQLESCGGPIDVIERRAKRVIGGSSLMLGGGLVSCVSVGFGQYANVLSGLGPGVLGGFVCVMTVWWGQKKWRDGVLRFERDWKMWRESLGAELKIQQDQMIESQLQTQFKVLKSRLSLNHESQVEEIQKIEEEVLKKVEDGLDEGFLK